MPCAGHFYCSSLLDCITSRAQYLLLLRLDLTTSQLPGIICEWKKVGEDKNLRIYYLVQLHFLHKCLLGRGETPKVRRWDISKVKRWRVRRERSAVNAAIVKMHLKVHHIDFYEVSRPEIYCKPPRNSFLRFESRRCWAGQRGFRFLEAHRRLAFMRSSS